ncbi:Rab geranylgeranyltransferase, variant 2 [Orbilia oligospora]|uniref:Geranylgeranyl transferase type-2 subunit alpha n=1 Tax=Orbilia oligospora TaxID=2813651 RepID=A0A8H8VIH3_ORBOL|nr:Rab geranylgeranyltransferase, variant 2 [Orbilia oligospora]
MTSHGVPRSSTTVRTPQAIQADLLKIEAYNNLVSEVQALKSKHTYSPTSLSTTSSLLTQNPESKLIPRVLSERGATIEERRTFLDGELGEMQTAVYTDPYDQSIQLYNHWLLLESCSSKQTTSTTSPVFSLTNSQKSETLLRTLEWMRELLDEEPDCRLLLEEMIFVGSLLRDLDETEEEEDVDRDEVKRDMQSWLEKLMEVDPMRGGRWREMQEKLM